MNRRLAYQVCDGTCDRYHFLTTGGYLCTDRHPRTFSVAERPLAIRQAYRRAVRRGWMRLCGNLALVTAMATALVAGFFLCVNLLAPGYSDEEWDDVPDVGWSETLPSGMPAPGAGS
jgi:hypothetical protein